MVKLGLCLIAILCLVHLGQQFVHRPPVTMRYAVPTSYPCMEDWNKVCRKDSDCCSGSCMMFFCKVVGIDVTTSSRKKRPRITINISK